MGVSSLARRTTKAKTRLRNIRLDGSPAAQNRNVVVESGLVVGLAAVGKIASSVLYSFGCGVLRTHK